VGLFSLLEEARRLHGSVVMWKNEFIGSSLRINSYEKADQRVIKLSYKIKNSKLKMLRKENFKNRTTYNFLDPRAPP